MKLQVCFSLYTYSIEWDDKGRGALELRSVSQTSLGCPESNPYLDIPSIKYSSRMPQKKTILTHHISVDTWLVRESRDHYYT
jgi:hypothetical protein